MNFLLTNDDGIHAPGLWAAADALAQLGRVLVVAPNQNYSGYGAALPPIEEMRFSSHQVPGRSQPNVTAYWVGGTPAACAQVGLSGALSSMPIDLVVSGINAGLNIGRDIFVSGTVGAAITARMMGWPAIAVSLDTAGNGALHWNTAAACLGEFLHELGDSLRAAPSLYNINAPNLPLADLAGVKVTRLSSYTCARAYRIEASTTDRLRLKRTYIGNEEHQQVGSDALAVAQGYVSLTQLHLFREELHVSALAEAGDKQPQPLYYGPNGGSHPAVTPYA